MAEIKIGGRTFKCDPLPAMDGIALVTKCLEAASPFMLLFDHGSEFTLAAVLEKAFRNLNSPSLRSLIEEIMGTCMVDNEPVVLGGNVQDAVEILEVTAWAVEAVHVGPFLHGGGLKRAGDRLMKMVAA